MTYVTTFERIGEERGEKRGEKIGEKRNKIENAKKMLERNFSIEDIVYVTGLTKKEILDIKKKM